MSDEKQPLSSLPTLERDFADIIMHRSNTDKQGIQSNIIAQRATYKVNDGSLLYIVEYIDKHDKSKVDHFFYDWYRQDGTVRMKFHSETHGEDKRYQTSTEPYHIHKDTEDILSNIDRYPNYNLRDLRSVLEFIRWHLYICEAEDHLRTNDKKYKKKKK